MGVILSFHDFKATKKLEDTFAEMKRYPADFYKVVSTATSLYDNVQMMKFLQAHSAQHEMVALCMGEQGIISGVLACAPAASSRLRPQPGVKKPGPARLRPASCAIRTASKWSMPRPRFTESWATL